MNIPKNTKATDPPGHSKATIHMRFSQREGVSPIPRPLQLGELSQALRSYLWAITYDSLRTSERSRPPRYDEPWNNILMGWHVTVLHEPIDEFTNECRYHDSTLKELFLHGRYEEVFDFVEFVMKANDCPHGYARNVSKALRITQAAYIVVDERVIFPASMPEEAEALENTLSILQEDSFIGARTHLLKAGKELNHGNFADSIRESIHAVESISRVIVPEAKTLAPALTALEKEGHLHGALKNGFSALYGFTCDEQGIRHPLLNKTDAEVDRESAVFMLGACASFLSYLTNKGRQAGLIK